MKKSWKFIKRCIKYTLIYLLVLIILWVLGILNYILGFFSFLPSINWGPQIIIKNASNIPTNETEKNGKLEIENLATTIPTQELSTEAPNYTIIPDVTSSSEIATVTPLIAQDIKLIETTLAPIKSATPTYLPPVAPTFSPTSKPTPTYTPTASPAPKLTPSPTIINTISPEVENVISESASEYINMFSPIIYTTAPLNNATNYVTANIPNTNSPTTTPEIILATLPPVQPNIIVTSCSQILFVEFNNEIIDTLVSTRVYKLPGLTITYDNHKIDITTDVEKALVSFILSKEGFASLYENEITCISIPYRTIPLNDIYQQLRETNTDMAEITWFYENGEYKCKAIIKKNFLDWLFRFPHGERYIIIE